MLKKKKEEEEEEEIPFKNLILGWWRIYDPQEVLSQAALCSAWTLDGNQRHVFHMGPESFVFYKP